MSTNELVFRKCKTDHCTAERSPLQQVIGDGFLPPPVAITHKFDGDRHSIALADPQTVGPKDRLISPLQAKALGLDLSKVPTDLYCPTAKGHIRDRTCADCLMYFPSINQKIKHKRACHKWSRTKLDDDYENGIVTDAECSPVRVLHPLQEGFYSVLFESGVLCWCDTLPQKISTFFVCSAYVRTGRCSCLRHVNS